MEQKIEKYTPINLGRITINLVYLLLFKYFKIEYSIILFYVYFHLLFSITWFVIIQFEFFIEKNHSWSGFIPNTLDILCTTLLLIITGNIYSFIIISYVIMTALTAADIRTTISLYSYILSIISFSSVAILVITGVVPNINILSTTVIVPTIPACILSTIILALGLFVIRALVRKFIKQNTDLYEIAEMEKEKVEKLLEELQKNYAIIEERNVGMNRELQLARIIQRGLIPEPPGDIKGVLLTALYSPMYEIGGDFYDFIRFKEKNKIGIFISDVSGHGVPAALITTMTKALINTSGNERTDPGKFLSYINSNMLGQTSHHFISAIYAIYNGHDNTLSYAHAGHPPGIIIRKGSISELKGNGYPLAVYHGYPYKVNKEILSQGDKVIFFTDGLLEARDSNGRFFEYEMMPRTLETFSHLPIRDLIPAVYSDLVTFRGLEGFDDDICIVGMEVE